MLIAFLPFHTTSSFNNEVQQCGHGVANDARCPFAFLKSDSGFKANDRAQSLAFFARVAPRDQ
jgi:hypothetical protein